MNTHAKNWLKFILGFAVCFLIRLISFRPPNIEPILATQMPFSKAYGKIAGFLFAFLSIALFDIVTGLSIGSLFFQQPFTEALTGQIPFTALRLLGNICFAAILSPAVYKFVIENKKLETMSIIGIFKPKQI